MARLTIFRLSTSHTNLIQNRCKQAEMTDHYKTSLLILHKLLQDSGYTHWRNWIAQDLMFWDKTKSTKHHISAFGGMGSINDIYVASTSSEIGIWKNELFEITGSLSYYLANNKSEYEKPNLDFIKKNVNEINGWNCEDCNHSGIDETNLNYFLAKQLLTDEFINYITEDKLLDIYNLESIIKSQKIRNIKSKTQDSIINSGIELSKNNTWNWKCPNCSSKRTRVYHWKLDDEYDLITKTKNDKSKAINKLSLFERIKAFIK